MREFEWIDRYLAPLAAEGAFDLKDDGAQLGDYVISTDSLHEGIHFLSSDPPYLVGCHLLRVNLSDCAAMGATPLYYLLNLGLRRDDGDFWMKELARAFADEQKKFGITLLGGDSSAVRHDVSLSATLIGRVPHKMLRRNAIKPDDIIAVTGTLGDAAFSLDERAAHSHNCEFFTHKRLRPEPPVSFAQDIASLAHASMDNSDGLYLSLRQMAQESKVALTIEIDQLPISPQLKNALPEHESLNLALAGGGDYELILSLPAQAWDEAVLLAKRHHISLTKIGTSHEGGGIHLTHQGKKHPAPQKVFSHFDKGKKSC